MIEIKTSLYKIKYKKYIKTLQIQARETRGTKALLQSDNNLKAKIKIYNNKKT